MEGMPRFPMYSPEWRTVATPIEHYNFSAQIKQYIQTHFQQDPSQFDKALSEFVEMRDKISQPFPSIELTCVMKRYYAQCLLMKNRFPLEDSSQFNVSWCWFDRLLDVPHAAVYSDINYEMANVMFNIAAVHARIAVDQPRDNDDGIKNAFMHFGYAAYPLQYIRDEMNASQWNTSDFDRDYLTFCLNVIMGQAQECMVEKALIDHRNPTVVARLTSHLHELYSKCREHVIASRMSEVLASTVFHAMGGIRVTNDALVKDWVNMCDMKAEIYAAISLLYTGMQAEEAEKHGERLACYRASMAHVNKAIKIASSDKRKDYRETVFFVHDVVHAKEKNAEKENDFIYHAKVPKPEEVVLAEPLSMACAYSFNPLDRSISGDDLFAGLIPTTVVKAASEYEEMKAQLKRECMERVAAHDQELESILSKMRLSELPLEDDSSMYIKELPDEMIEKNAYFNAHPDFIPNLLDQLTKVADQARQAEHILSSLTNRLDVIDLPQLASDEGLKAVRDEVKRLSDHSTQAKQANIELHRALADHSELLQTLAQPFETFVKIFQGEVKNLGSTPEGEALLKIRRKVDEMREQRIKLMAMLDDDLKNDDIGSKLLVEKGMDNTEGFRAAIAKHDKVKGFIEQNCAAQEKVVAALLEANADFAEHRRRFNDDSEKRRSHILELVRASDVYTHVSEKVGEARLFYEKLLSRAKKLTGAVEGIEAAFGEIKKKQEDDVRAAEKRVEDARRAKEARAALDDFAPPEASPQKKTLEARNSGGAEPRRAGRVVDYMEFYRQRMAGASGAAPHGVPAAPSPYPTQSYTPPPLSVSVHSYPPSQASPVPSVLGSPHGQHPPPSNGYGGGGATFVPQSAPYHQTSTANHYSAPQAYTQSELQHQYAPAHAHHSPQPAPQASYHPQVYQQPPVSQPQMYHQPPVSQPQVYQLPPSQPQVYHQQPAPVPQTYQSVPPETYSTPSVYQNGYSASSQQPSYQPLPPSQPQQYIPTAILSHPSVSSTPPVVATSSYAPPTSSTFPAASASCTYSVPAAPVTSYASSTVSSAATFQQPAAALPTSYSTQSSMYGTQPTTANYSNGPTSASSFTPSTTSFSGSGQTFSNRAPSTAGPPTEQSSGAPSVASTTTHAYSSIPSTQQYNAWSAGAYAAQTTNTNPSLPPQQQQNVNPSSSLPPAVPQPDSAPPPSAFSGRLPSLAELSATLKSTSIPSTDSMSGVSPWHRGATQGSNPWGAPSMAGRVPVVSGPAPSQQPPVGPPAPVTATTMPPMSSGQLATIDLLSSVFDSSGPAPLQPAVVTQTSVHTQSAAAPLAPAPIFAQPEIAPIRPAATVLPIKQQSAPPPFNGGDQILSMVNPTSVGYNPTPAPSDADAPKAPAEGLVLQSISDPNTFNIGSPDKSKLEKRLLHASIRGEGEKPPLDPNDPLNALDPFWKAK